MTELTLLASLIVLLIFSGLIILQLLLALGKPYAYLAYGGKYDTILPKNLRILSIVAIFIFLLASILVLVRIDIIVNFPFLDLATIGIWLFAFYLALNTLANATSKSRSEQKYMTPLSLTASVCLFIIALGL